MEKLIADFIRIQLALAEAWVSALMQWWRNWQQVMPLNAELLQHPAFQRWHNLMPTGAEWFEQYGRRSHDVDVDHLR